MKERDPGEYQQQPIPEDISVRWFLEIESRLFSEAFPGISLTTLHPGRGFWVKGTVCRGLLWLEARGSSTAIEAAPAR